MSPAAPGTDAGADDISWIVNDIRLRMPVDLPYKTSGDSVFSADSVFSSPTASNVFWHGAWAS